MIISFGENFSFEAILLIYINKISNPPINIKKVIIDIQEAVIILDRVIVIKVVWTSSNIPIDMGIFIVGIIIEMNIIVLIIIIFISANILIKILVLDTKDVT